MVKYKHSESQHNLESPSIIVPEIIKLLGPKNVVDIGCGLGTFLHVFKQNGISDVLGVDGQWVSKNLLHQYLEPNEFLEADLEKEICLDKKYDLAISLEVAEHLTETSADTFVQSLINAGELILFSAAIPYQGGQNHINEQPLTYWEEKFARHNYKMHDIIRPMFWDNPDVFWWYKQNMVLITPNHFEVDRSKEVPVRNIAHYELLKAKTEEFERVVKGKRKPQFYLKQFIFSIFGYERIQKLKGFVTKNER